MDVDRIMKEVPTEVGTAVECTKIAEIIRVAIQDSRFLSVTTAWRKHIFNTTGIRIKRDGGAFHFLAPTAALEETKRDFKKVGRAAGRATVRAKVIDPRQLSDEQRETQRLAIRMGEELLDVAQRSMKAIAPPKPIKPNVPVQDVKS